MSIPWMREEGWYDRTARAHCRGVLVQEAAELRPLLISELTVAFDLFTRDRARKTFVLLSASLQPRLPFLGALPTLPPPPVLVPGKGFMESQAFIDLFFPKLSDEEEIQLDTQVSLAAAILGTDAADIGEVSPANIQHLLFSPSEQVRELQDVLRQLAGNSVDLAVTRNTALTLVNNLVDQVCERVAVPREQLFPVLPQALRAERAVFKQAVGRQLSAAEFAEISEPAVHVHRATLSAPMATRRSSEEAGQVAGGSVTTLKKAGLSSTGVVGHVGQREEVLKAELEALRPEGRMFVSSGAETLLDGDVPSATTKVKPGKAIRMLELKQRQ